MSETEINFDGLIGPTHNYAGLSFGNVASQGNAAQVSNPMAAALEGLEKMATLHKLGIPQAVLPPHERPHLLTLRQLGFSGSDATILNEAARTAPYLLTQCASASNMWTANAATVSPSNDTADGRVHFTPANLTAMPHRAIEAPTTKRVLQAIFADETAFAIHDPLPSHPSFGDEGAANHTRLYAGDPAQALELFVYGRAEGSDLHPQVFPARQRLAASQAVARSHRLSPERTLFVQQTPEAIDAGAFHNDVVAVGHQNVLFFHEGAFADPDALSALDGIHMIEVPQRRVPLAIAVKSYLFNSQLVSRGGSKGLHSKEMTLIAPAECEAYPEVTDMLADIIAADNPIRQVRFVNVRQSMRNGGGPACLRLRVALTESECARVNSGIRFDEALFAALTRWVKSHYRDRLVMSDLADPALLVESRTALDELSQILKLGTIYDFQRA